MIQATLSSYDNILSVSELCRIANVSRSGYYRWVAATESRARREAQDQNDFALILQAYNHRGYAKGARSTYMRLLHLETPVCMNLKKIRRIMNKYGLNCPIRKANPYRRVLNAMRTSHVAPNLLQREFREHGPRKVLLTDITYLTYGSGQRAYMVTILDAYTKQLLAYEVSRSLKIDFVLNAVKRLIKIHGVSLQAETLINSDQGSHYHHLSRWTKISVPSIYRKVLQLNEQGYLQSDIVKGDKFADKAVYSITDKGRSYFEQLMNTYANEKVSLLFDFNVVVTNLNKMGKEKALELVQQLRNNITASAKANDEYAVNYANIPLVGRTIFDQQRLLYRSLLEWLDAFESQFKGS